MLLQRWRKPPAPRFAPFHLKEVLSYPRRLRSLFLEPLSQSRSLFSTCGLEFPDVPCLEHTVLVNNPDNNQDNHARAHGPERDSSTTRCVHALMLAQARRVCKFGLAGRRLCVGEIFGTEGSLVVGESGELQYAKMGDRDWHDVAVDLGEAPPNTKVGGWSRGFLNFAREIVAALKEGRTDIEHAATFDDGLRVQIALDRAHKSNLEGRFVSVG